MPTLSRKRRAPVEEPEEEEAATISESQTQREDEDGDFGGASSSSTSTDHLAKNLVRYALACEYSRATVKRQDISSKILGPQSRQFQAVFDRAQFYLQDIFGMEMVELPNREKVTVRQKRAAQASESQSKSSKQWVLTNMLPEKYRDPEILAPSRIPTSEMESSYVGLYTMTISLILLSGGSMPEAKLDRFLKRLNADQSTPVDRTDKLLARMIKEGYIVRLKETSSGEEVIDYMVGPRGKTEVGEQGVIGMVKAVYGDDVTEDLNERIERSLGIAETKTAAATQNATNGDSAAGPSTQTAARRGPGRARRPRSAEEDEGNEEE